jgi:hypothetical protein
VIDNIDQAFATEQARAKLYKKINKLPELEKSKYVCTIKSKLVSIARGNREMVQERMELWAEGKLQDKHVEKLAVMVYFMEREDIYKENEIAIDFGRLNKVKLRREIEKVFKWRSFTYVKDLMTQDKIHEFLNYLLSKLT